MSKRHKECLATKWFLGSLRASRAIKNQTGLFNRRGRLIETLGYAFLNSQIESFVFENCTKGNSIIKGLKHDHKSKICFRFKSTVQELYAHNLYSFARHKYNFRNAYIQMIISYLRRRNKIEKHCSLIDSAKSFF